MCQPQIFAAALRVAAGRVSHPPVCSFPPTTVAPSGDVTAQPPTGSSLTSSESDVISLEWRSLSWAFCHFYTILQYQRVQARALKQAGRHKRERVSHGTSFLAPGSLARRRLARVIHHHHREEARQWGRELCLSLPYSGGWHLEPGHPRRSFWFSPRWGVPIAGQIPGNGNQGRVLPSNTRGITRYLVIPVFEVPDGQRQPRGNTPQRRPRASASSIRFFCMPIAITHGPRQRVTKYYRAQL